MTEHVIYIVIGSCGEYSDSREWPVCWRATKEEADAICVVCTAQANQYKMCENSYGWEEAEKLKLTMFDQHFDHDYAETKYYIWRVSDAPVKSTDAYSWISQQPRQNPVR